MLVLIVLGMHNLEGISYSERIQGLLSMLSAKRSVSCRVRKLLSSKLMYCLVTMAGEATQELGMFPVPIKGLIRNRWPGGQWLE